MRSRARTFRSSSASAAAAGALPDSRQKKQTLLHAAAAAGSPACVAYLARNCGALATSHNRRKETALMLSAEHAHADDCEAVRALVKAGSPLDAISCHLV